MSVPEIFKEIDLGMSNFDHTVDDGFESAIIDKECFGRHAAWNFNGIVYHKDGRFHEDIWQYHSYIETMSADSLGELQENVNNKYGYD